MYNFCVVPTCATFVNNHDHNNPPFPIYSDPSHHFPFLESFLASCHGHCCCETCLLFCLLHPNFMQIQDSDEVLQIHQWGLRDDSLTLQEVRGRACYLPVLQKEKLLANSVNENFAASWVPLLQNSKVTRFHQTKDRERPYISNYFWEFSSPLVIVFQ